MRNRIHPDQAKLLGMTIDTTCYPWVGYTGPRFSPSTFCEVYTDLESTLLRCVDEAIARLERQR